PYNFSNMLQLRAEISLDSELLFKICGFDFIIIDVREKNQEGQEKVFQGPLSKFSLHRCTDTVTLNRKSCNLSNLYLFPNLVVVHLYGHQPSTLLNYDPLTSNGKREVLRCLIVLNQLQIAVVVLMHVPESIDPRHETAHSTQNFFFLFVI